MTIWGYHSASQYPDPYQAVSSARAPPLLLPMDDLRTLSAAVHDAMWRPVYLHIERSAG